jgi:phosphotransferase system HPr (HPr) family protein
VEKLTCASGLVEAGKSIIMTLDLQGSAEATSQAEGETLSSETITLTNPAGLHARPAAVFASAAKRFAADIQLQLGDKAANAKSVVGIMGLATVNGDQVRVIATGPMPPPPLPNCPSCCWTAAVKAWTKRRPLLPRHRPAGTAGQRWRAGWRGCLARHRHWPHFPSPPARI